MRTQLIIILSLLNVCLVPAQERDTRVRTYITPTRIVWQQDSDHITNCNFLLNQGDGQAYWGAYYDYESIDTGLQGKKEKTVKAATYCRLSSTDGARPAILLDFGKELQGGIQIVTGAFSNKSPIKMRVRFGESVSEAMCEIDGKNGASNDHAIRDFVVTLPWLGVLEVGNSGFRFARIDLMSDSTEVSLKEIRAISTFRDIPYKGSFRSSDERLNKIWQTGAYTVHLNMQEYLWDGIKRDRLVWLGDMHPEVMTVNTVFGYNEVVPKSLDLIRDVTPLPAWMNGISAYSIWWLLIQRDWYYHHGDVAYLKEHGDMSYEDLQAKAQATTSRFNELSTQIKDMESRLSQNGELQKQIVNYSKTRSVYIAYRKAGYSKKFRAEHEADILIHQAAKKYFDSLGVEKLPTVKTLREEYAEVLEAKRKAYAEYKQVRKEMRELQNVKANIDYLLGPSAERTQEKEHS